ncbi:DUF1549 and DUF1553 domain-containing protein [Fimbriiglobus ruber]|uniref:Cytochrome c domain-containing protein n=1 Tax=Fimbriiglobus ruber TaxID=1908690 RepID=A0A225DNZ5_9BACT|nr:DUF1549 and DUF1553 domain-containing protein [Fimbriiglobus ruber]OWK38075.1 hypothetical protein FRUB_07195 [Fimbriiglobus ruber]
MARSLFLAFAAVGSLAVLRAADSPLPSDPTSRDHWAYKRPVRPPVPRVEGTALPVRNPIDAFVFAKLKEKGLAPAPEADKRALIRRATFDLTGLPPTPEEVDAFLKDTSATAFEAVVDRLLASPRYGERWARHWLDAVHFADTHGTEHDLVCDNAWRYRDYVIERLNADVPYDRFIKEQLAADVFYPADTRLTAALGFLAAGPWDQSTAFTAPKTFDYLDRDDMVTQVMSTFASASVHCARCHDHKFDPISQDDYYALQAVFAGVGRGDVPYDADPTVAQARRKWQKLVAAADARDAGTLLGAEARAIAAAWEKTAFPTGTTWDVPKPVAVAAASGGPLRQLPDGSYLAAGPAALVDTYTLTLPPPVRPLTALRLEVLPDDSLPSHGPGRAENGNLHLSEIEVQVVAPGSGTPRKLRVRRAAADFDQEGWTVAHAIDGNEHTAWGIHPHEGEPHEAVFELTEAAVIPPTSQLIVVLKQVHGRGHVIGRFRVAVTGDSAARVAPLSATIREALAIPAEKRTDAHRLTLAAHAVRERATAELAALPAPAKVYAAAAVFEPFQQYRPWATPKVVNVLKRGDIAKPGAVALPGAMEAVEDLSARFAGIGANDEAARRAALAGWLADPKNPLTWRSVVNRVWHHHFGRGIVDTPNDFGRMGGTPTHPELLDWLAVEFRDTGMSLKKLHRLIVTSSTYRQAARPDERAAKEDADARLLWRSPRRRLDAESYRDAVLAVSGRLDLTTGGPGVRQFALSKGNFLTPRLNYAVFDWDAPGANRRSIYRFVYRTLPDPFLSSLDFPDASQLAPVRGASASPVQALALFNNPFVLRHSEHFATRLAGLSADPREQVRHAFRLALQRTPTPTEQDAFTAHAGKHGLAAVARVLFNSNEFLFVE